MVERTGTAAAKRDRGLRWLAFPIFCALLLAGSPALAACVELARAGDDGIGGMGLAGDDDGIGGMGLEGRPPEVGIGVYGTITGFGSVCVNGLRIELPETLRVAGPGASLPATALAVGHVVSIDAGGAEGTWVAEEIRLRPALAGPLGQIGEDGAFVEVLRQRVDLDAIGGAGALAGIGPGEPLLVYGVRGTGRGVQASRIETGRGASRAQVWGIAKTSGGEATVAGVEVVFAEGRMPRDGDRVVVDGDWSPETGRLERARWKRGVALLADHPSVSVEVVVDRSGSKPVLLLDGEVFEVDGLDDRVEAFATGERIWLKGRRLPDGSIEIQRLDHQPPGLALGRRGGSESHPGQGRGHDGLSPGKSGDAPGHAAGHPSSNSVNAPNSTNPGRARAESPERGSGVVQRPDRPVRIEKPERPPRPERGRPDLPDRVQRPDKPEKNPRPERPDKPGRKR